MNSIDNIIKPRFNDQTIYQLNQIKIFIDTALKESCSHDFKSSSQKIDHLLNTLYNIRDFITTQTHDNEVRSTILKQLKDLELEESSNESNADS